jgi:hypothetical protein
VKNLYFDGPVHFYAKEFLEHGRSLRARQACRDVRGEDQQV